MWWGAAEAGTVLPGTFAFFEVILFESSHRKEMFWTPRAFPRLNTETPKPPVVVYSIVEYGVVGPTSNYTIYFSIITI